MFKGNKGKKPSINNVKKPGKMGKGHKHPAPACK
jgi:hypothetical protein